MKYKIFAVHDSKAEAFMTPFFMNTENQARRSFVDAMGNPELPFGRHPQDFTLFHIGSFNDHNGEVEAVIPVSLGNGLEFRAAMEKETSQQKLNLETNDSEISDSTSVQ